MGTLESMQAGLDPAVVEATRYANMVSGIVFSTLDAFDDFVWRTYYDIDQPAEYSNECEEVAMYWITAYFDKVVESDDWLSAAMWPFIACEVFDVELWQDKVHQAMSTRQSSVLADTFMRYAYGSL